MTRRIMLTSTLVATFALVAQAQTENGPVTSATVDAMMAKVDPVFAKSAGLKAYSHTSFGKGTASRREIVDLYYSLYQHYKSSFRTTPRPFRIIQPYLDMNSGEMKDKLEEMVEWGFVPPASPVVTGGMTLTADEFGDSLGYVYLQLRRYTYQPDPDWSGALSGC